MRPLSIAIALLAGLPALDTARAEDMAFTSPTGNIRCLMSEDSEIGTRCDLAASTPSFAEPPEDCDGDWGNAFVLFDEGQGEVACVTDALPADDPRVLPYGTRLENGGITCASERTGMTCTNDAGGGFTLSRASQTVF